MIIGIYFVFLHTMKHLLITFILFSVLAQAGNKIYLPTIKTLTTIVNDDWQNRPVMVLGSNDLLHIGYDELSHDVHRYLCHLTRCEADWTESIEIFESEWLEGFNDFPIDDYQHSLNTAVKYTHYEFLIPNSKCRIRMSGNYRLSIFDEDAGHEKVLDAEFYVIDPLVSVQLAMTTNTDIDVNQSHQQISMTINYNNQLKVVSPDEEIYTIVMQNWNEKTARIHPHPQYIYQHGLKWEHLRELIFDAGNEYHKYEILGVTHPTMGIERITWDGQCYQAYPFATTQRYNYLTDESANGAFCVRNSECSEIDYTCEYTWVNYTIESPYYGEIYIQGQWTNSADDTTYRMQYDINSQCYRAQIMQKQGYYSYCYITQNGTPAPTEGNFFQTNNKYQALIYYKELGGRTWHLVGYRGLDAR